MHFKMQNALQNAAHARLRAAFRTLRAFPGRFLRRVLFLNAPPRVVGRARALRSPGEPFRRRERDMKVIPGGLPRTLLDRLPRFALRNHFFDQSQNVFFLYQEQHRIVCPFNKQMNVFNCTEQFSRGVFFVLKYFPSPYLLSCHIISCFWHEVLPRSRDLSVSVSIISYHTIH